MTETRTPVKFCTAVVTGATGFIGGHLAHRLHDAGVSVTAIVRDSSDPARIAALPGQAEAIPVHDDGSRLINIVKQATPDVVFHLAARFSSSHTHADIDGVITDNVTLTARVCEAATAAGCPALVVAGTAWQNAGSTPGDPTPSPNSFYAASKQAADDIIDYYCGQAGLNTVTLKIYDSYGPNDPRRKFLATLRDAAANQTSVEASPGDQLLHLVHVDDLVDGFVHAGNLLYSGEVCGRASHTLPSGEPVTLRAIAETWMRANGENIDIRWGGRPHRSGEVMVPWEGVPLPGWSPRIDLATGLGGC